ncbi:MAG TPA: hypothetical protein VM600_09215, partial [Actinomycetota bacterium]|nr:hypothetical protein [Actinomycetota bacterium]
MSDRLFLIVEASVWLVAAVALLRRGNRIGWIAGVLAALAGAALSSTMRPAAIALMPAGGLHLLLAMPDGRLLKSSHRLIATAGYIAGIAGAVAMMGTRSDTLIVGALAAVGLIAGLG